MSLQLHPTDSVDYAKITGAENSPMGPYTLVKVMWYFMDLAAMELDALRSMVVFGSALSQHVLKVSSVERKIVVQLPYCEHSSLLAYCERTGTSASSRAPAGIMPHTLADGRYRSFSASRAVSSGIGPGTAAVFAHTDSRGYHGTRVHDSHIVTQT